MKKTTLLLLTGLLLFTISCKQEKEVTQPNLKGIAYEAFIYAYPMMEQVKTVNGMMQFMGLEFSMRLILQ